MVAPETHDDAGSEMATGAETAAPAESRKKRRRRPKGRGSKSQTKATSSARNTPRNSHSWGNAPGTRGPPGPNPPPEGLSYSKKIFLGTWFLLKAKSARARCPCLHLCLCYKLIPGSRLVVHTSSHSLFVRCSYAIRALFVRCSYECAYAVRALFVRCSYEFALTRELRDAPVCVDPPSPKLLCVPAEQLTVPSRVSVSVSVSWLMPWLV